MYEIPPFHPLWSKILWATSFIEHRNIANREKIASNVIPQTGDATKDRTLLTVCTRVMTLLMNSLSFSVVV
jgi:hypothetical protein